MAMASCKVFRSSTTSITDPPWMSPKIPTGRARTKTILGRACTPPQFLVWNVGGLAIKRIHSDGKRNKIKKKEEQQCETRVPVTSSSSPRVHVRVLYRSAMDGYNGQ